MPHKAIAIVVAMPVEVAPLLGRIQPQNVDGVDLFELPGAIVAVGGIGRKFARRAAEVVVQHAQPNLLLSAGIVGAVSPGLKVGDVAAIREVVDVTTGIRYSTAQGGDWVLATSQDVSDVAEKQELRARFGADVVDMEGAAVAQVAKERGIEFASLKSISDDAAFEMPPFNRFIDENGRFATGKFVAYLALHPKWWSAVGKMRLNSNIAAANLCRAVEHLIESSCP
jgi:adenosylhomocysteine nucleosidase